MEHKKNVSECAQSMKRTRMNATPLLMWQFHCLLWCNPFSCEIKKNIIDRVRMRWSLRINRGQSAVTSCHISLEKHPKPENWVWSDQGIWSILGMFMGTSISYLSLQPLKMTSDHKIKITRVISYNGELNLKLCKSSKQNLILQTSETAEAKQILTKLTFSIILR